jgi:hypothetical protein
MSTLSVTNLKNAASATNNIVLATDGSVSISGNNYSPQTGFKNRIINGAMTIDQRNAGAAINSASGAGNYAVDRFAYNASQTGKVNLQQTTANIAQTNGFGYCLAVTSTSAYSVTSTDYFFVEQRIEGSNIADIGWGTSASKAVAMSFVVYSSLTGTFGGSLIVGSGSYPFSYSVPVANTWTQISVSVPANTTYTPTSLTNGTGVRVMFGLGSGSTLTAAAGSWQSGTFVQPTGSVSVVGTSGATFYITGVQLEKGTAATPFEFRSIGTELGLCQRYCRPLGDGAVGNATQATAVTLNLVCTPEMRAAPTATLTDTSVNISDNFFSDHTSSGSILASANISAYGGRFNINGFTGLTQGRFYNAFGNTNGSFILLSSEL